MSVKIFRKVYDDEHFHFQEEDFEIYKTDSLETIKSRYFIKHEIFPRLANFKVVSPVNEVDDEKVSSESKSVKIFDKINKSKLCKEKP